MLRLNETPPPRFYANRRYSSLRRGHTSRRFCFEKYANSHIAIRLTTADSCRVLLQDVFENVRLINSDEYIFRSETITRILIRRFELINSRAGFRRSEKNYNIRVNTVKRYTSVCSWSF